MTFSRRSRDRGRDSRRRSRGGALFLPLLAVLLWSLPAFAAPPDPAAAGAPAAGTPAAGAPAAGDSGKKSDAGNDRTGDSGVAVVVRIDSAIHPVAEQFIAEAVAHADRIGARVLVLELNTPGGLLTSTRNIVTAMAGATTPVVVFVGPSGAQAASAGFFILMGSDVAAMAPGTNTGAAHPVAGGGQDIEGHMGEKVEQDSLATIRSLAQQHGRNVELAEAAVRESRSFTAAEALEGGLVEALAPTVGALLRDIDGRVVQKVGGPEITLATAEVTVDELEMGVFQRFLAVIVHPEIAYILFGLGLLGLYVELSNPGAVLPGVVGAIFLILGFYALSVLPINFAGIALILLAMLLFLAELHLASHGVLTAGGVIALVLGSIMLFKDAEPAMRLGLEVIVGTALVILLVVGFLLTKAWKVRHTRVMTGAEGMVTEVGVARTDLDPRGKVFVHGEIWDAEAETPPIAAGAEIEVTSIDGLRLRVRARGPALPHTATVAATDRKGDAPCLRSS